MPTTDSLLEHLAEALATDRLAIAITEMAVRHPDRPALVTGAGGGGGDRRVVDYATLGATLADFEARLDRIRPAGIVATAERVEALVVIAAACGRQRVPLAFLAGDSRDLAGPLVDWLPVDDALALPADAAGRQRHEPASVPPPVIVATSGTSGPPKLVDHAWDSVLAAARLAEQWQGLGWLLVYDPARWAGIQVWAQAMLSGGWLVVPESRDPDVVARALVDESVAVLPATPTLMRRLLTSADRSVLVRGQVDRITLGGEAADAQLLADMRGFYPVAKITQIYATTELGEVFRVADGQAGFPVAWVGRALPGGVRLSIRRDGELVVQLSRDTAEVLTGDMVERRGDRYEFAGRRGDVIVVGGAKVYPRRIEEVLRGVPGVADARVWGLPSAITGELVAAEIVTTVPLPEGLSPDGVRAAALTACRERLEPAAVPRVLDLVKRIATTTAGKTPRTARRP
jgi:acyl-CoA synthetase (AMP-forming)/AMP-acid ligase II